MRGSGLIVWGVALVLCLSFSVFAQDQYEYALPLEKTVGPGNDDVLYDGILYHFSTTEKFYVKLEKIDDGHVRLYVKPLKVSIQINCEVSVQWGSFQPVTLQVNSSDGSSCILGTETGYAEK